MRGRSATQMANDLRRRGFGPLVRGIGGNTRTRAGGQTAGGGGG